jgi:nucleoside-diphosphate-sugar epimerase
VRLLLTGASSFTGYWFAQELASAGHEVTATFTRKDVATYGDEERGQRVADTLKHCRPVFDCRFGDDTFQEVVRTSDFDVLCHHAANVTDYKSPDFDIHRALEGNTHRLPEVLGELARTGCQRVVLTGSVFEGGEGAGSEGLPHFSPYSLSKALTAEVFRHHCREAGLRLGKFVIPNPFGPREDPRFTAYLMRTWLAGSTASVQTPHYVRDNIQVSLLARAYLRFLEDASDERAFTRFNPSGYVESQGAFARRFAAEMRERLRLPCALELAAKHAFTEPRARINTDVLDSDELRWDEAAAWDAIADYYARRLGEKPPA